eukprot:gene11625-8013_t
MTSTSPPGASPTTASSAGGDAYAWIDALKIPSVLFDGTVLLPSSDVNSFAAALKPMAEQVQGNRLRTMAMKDVYLSTALHGARRLQLYTHLLLEPYLVAVAAAGEDVSAPMASLFHLVREIHTNLLEHLAVVEQETSASTAQDKENTHHPSVLRHVAKMLVSPAPHPTTTTSSSASSAGDGEPVEATATASSNPLTDSGVVQHFSFAECCSSTAVGNQKVERLSAWLEKMWWWRGRQQPALAETGAACDPRLHMACRIIAEACREARQAASFSSLADAHILVLLTLLMTHLRDRFFPGSLLGAETEGEQQQQQQQRDQHDALRYVLRLLLQYTDPELSLYFDGKRIDAGKCLLNWIQRWFWTVEEEEDEAEEEQDHGTTPTPITANSPSSPPLTPILRHAILPVVDYLVILEKRELMPYVALGLLLSHRQAFLRVAAEPHRSKAEAEAKAKAAEGKDTAKGEAANNIPTEDHPDSKQETANAAADMESILQQLPWRTLAFVHTPQLGGRDTAQVLSPRAEKSGLPSWQQLFSAAIQRPMLGEMHSVPLAALPLGGGAGAGGTATAAPPLHPARVLFQNAELLFRSTPLSAQRALSSLQQPVRPLGTPSSVPPSPPPPGAATTTGSNAPPTATIYEDPSVAQRSPAFYKQYYATLPSLPIEDCDMLQSFGSPSTPFTATAPRIAFRVLDCRSHKSFEYARLPNAVHVGDVVALDDRSVQKLITRAVAYRGEHLVLFGAGRSARRTTPSPPPPVAGRSNAGRVSAGPEEETSLLMMFAMRLVQHGRLPFVGLCVEGMEGMRRLIYHRKVPLQRGPAPAPAGDPSSLQQQQQQQQRRPGAGPTAAGGTPATATAAAAAIAETGSAVFSSMKNLFSFAKPAAESTFATATEPSTSEAAAVGMAQAGGGAGGIWPAFLDFRPAPTAAAAAGQKRTATPPLALATPPPPPPQHLDPSASAGGPFSRQDPSRSDVASAVVNTAQELKDRSEKGLQLVGSWGKDVLEKIREVGTAPLAPAPASAPPPSTSATAAGPSPSPANPQPAHPPTPDVLSTRTPPSEDPNAIAGVSPAAAAATLLSFFRPGQAKANAPTTAPAGDDENAASRSHRIFAALSDTLEEDEGGGAEGAAGASPAMQSVPPHKEKAKTAAGEVAAAEDVEAEMLGIITSLPAPTTRGVGTCGISMPAGPAAPPAAGGTEKAAPPTTTPSRTAPPPPPSGTAAMSSAVDDIDVLFDNMFGDDVVPASIGGGNQSTALHADIHLDRDGSTSGVRWRAEETLEAKFLVGFPFLSLSLSLFYSSTYVWIHPSATRNTGTTTATAHKDIAFSVTTTTTTTTTNNNNNNNTIETVYIQFSLSLTLALTPLISSDRRSRKGPSFPFPQELKDHRRMDARPATGTHSDHPARSSDGGDTTKTQEGRDENVKDFSTRCAAGETAAASPWEGEGPKEKTPATAGSSFPVPRGDAARRMDGRTIASYSIATTTISCSSGHWTPLPLSSPTTVEEMDNNEQPASNHIQHNEVEKQGKEMNHTSGPAPGEEAKEATAVRSHTPGWSSGMPSTAAAPPHHCIPSSPVPDAGGSRCRDSRAAELASPLPATPSRGSSAQGSARGTDVWRTPVSPLHRSRLRSAALSSISHSPPPAAAADSPGGGLTLLHTPSHISGATTPAVKRKSRKSSSATALGAARHHRSRRVSPTPSSSATPGTAGQALFPASAVHGCAPPQDASRSPGLTPLRTTPPNATNASFRRHARRSGSTGGGCEASKSLSDTSSSPTIPPTSTTLTPDGVAQSMTSSFSCCDWGIPLVLLTLLYLFFVLLWFQPFDLTFWLDGSLQGSSRGGGRPSRQSRLLLGSHAGSDEGGSNTSGATTVGRRRPLSSLFTTNYASSFLGAGVIAGTPGCQGDAAVLVDKKDSYMLCPCAVPHKEFVVQLIREVTVKMFVLRNEEHFSSGVREFVLLGSNRYPTTHWVVLARLSAENHRGRQYFTQLKPHGPVRFLKFQWVSSYGSEPWCTLTSLHVYGVDTLESLTAFEEDPSSGGGPSSNEWEEEELFTPGEETHQDQEDAEARPTVEQPLPAEGSAAAASAPADPSRHTGSSNTSSLPTSADELWPMDTLLGFVSDTSELAEVVAATMPAGLAPGTCAPTSTAKASYAAPRDSPTDEEAAPETSAAVHEADQMHNLTAEERWQQEEEEEEEHHQLPEEEEAELAAAAARLEVEEQAAQTAAAEAAALLRCEAAYAERLVALQLRREATTFHLPCDEAFAAYRFGPATHNTSAMEVHRRVLERESERRRGKEATAMPLPLTAAEERILTATSPLYFSSPLQPTAFLRQHPPSFRRVAWSESSIPTLEPPDGKEETVQWGDPASETAYMEYVCLYAETWYPLRNTCREEAAARRRAAEAAAASAQEKKGRGGASHLQPTAEKKKSKENNTEAIDRLRNSPRSGSTTSTSNNSNNSNPHNLLTSGGARKRTSKQPPLIAALRQLAKHQEVSQQQMAESARREKEIKKELERIKGLVRVALSRNRELLEGQRHQNETIRRLENELRLQVLSPFRETEGGSWGSSATLLSIAAVVVSLTGALYNVLSSRRSSRRYDGAVRRPAAAVRVDALGSNAANPGTAASMVVLAAASAGADASFVVPPPYDPPPPPHDDDEDDPALLQCSRSMADTVRSESQREQSGSVSRLSDWRRRFGGPFGASAGSVSVSSASPPRRSGRRSFSLSGSAVPRSTPPPPPPPRAHTPPPPGAAAAPASCSGVGVAEADIPRDAPLTLPVVCERRAREERSAARPASETAGSATTQTAIHPGEGGPAAQEDNVEEERAARQENAAVGPAHPSDDSLFQMPTLNEIRNNHLPTRREPCTADTSGMICFDEEAGSPTARMVRQKLGLSVSSDFTLCVHHSLLYVSCRLSHSRTVKNASRTLEMGSENIDHPASTRVCRKSSHNALLTFLSLSLSRHFFYLALKLELREKTKGENNRRSVAEKLNQHEQEPSITRYYWNWNWNWEKGEETRLFLQLVYQWRVHTAHIYPPSLTLPAMTCSLLSTVLAMKKLKLSAGIQREVCTTLDFPPHYWDTDQEELAVIPFHAILAAPLPGEGLDIRLGGSGLAAATQPPPPPHDRKLSSHGPAIVSPASSKPSGKRGDVTPSGGGALSPGGERLMLVPPGASSPGARSTFAGLNSIKPFAITAMFQAGPYVAAGYEDGAVVVSRLKEQGHNPAANSNVLSTGSTSELNSPCMVAPNSTSAAGGPTSTSAASLPSNAFSGVTQPWNSSVAVHAGTSPACASASAASMVSPPAQPGPHGGPSSSRQARGGSGNSVSNPVGGWANWCFTIDELCPPLTAHSAPLGGASFSYPTSNTKAGAAAGGKAGGGGANGGNDAAGGAGGGDKGPTVVKAVHIVPHGPSHFMMAVAYTNWAFITVEQVDSCSFTPTTTLLPSQGVPRKPQRKQVKITNEFLQASMQHVLAAEREKEGRPQDDGSSAAAGKGPRRGSQQGAGGGGGGKQGGGPSAGGAGSPGGARGRRGQQNTGNATAATVVIDSITLSSCGTYVAVSLTSPGLYVLLFELPVLHHLVPGAGAARAGTPGSASRSRSGAAVAGGPLRLNEHHIGAAAAASSSAFAESENACVVEPARLLSFCSYTDASVKHNTINGKSVKEMVQGMAAANTAALASNSTSKDKKMDASSNNSPVGAGASLQSVSLGPNGLPRHPTPMKLDVFSQCFFLADNNGLPLQLVVVWVNSSLYCRMPLRSAPHTFKERLRTVNAPTPPPEERDETASNSSKHTSGRSGGGAGAAGGGGKGGARGADKGQAPRAAGRKGGKGKAQTDAASQQKKSHGTLCEPFDGVLRCRSVEPIQIAALSPSEQLLALGCAGGSVQLLSARRSLATASALPPPRDLPDELRTLPVNVSVVSLEVQHLPNPAAAAAGGQALFSGWEVEELLGGGSNRQRHGMGGSETRAHVIAGTALTAPEKPPVFGASSLFIALDNDGTGGRGGVRHARSRAHSSAAGFSATAGASGFFGPTTLALPALRLPQDASSPGRKASSLRGPSPSTSAAGGPPTPGEASDNWNPIPPQKSLYITGLPAPLCGALMADPIPFALLFLDTYVCKPPPSVFEGGGGAFGGTTQREFSASVRTNTGNLSGGGTVSTPNPLSGGGGGGGGALGSGSLKGPHHCLVWDTHYNAILGSFPFSLYGDCAKPVKDPAALSNFNPSPIPTGRAGRIGSLSGALVGNQPYSGRKGGAASERGVESMNISLRGLPATTDEDAAAGGRVVAVQNARSTSHSVHHSAFHTAVGSNSSGAGTLLVSPAVLPPVVGNAVALNFLPVSSASGGLLWLQNEDAASSPRHEAQNSMTLTRNKPTTGGDGGTTGSHTSDSVTGGASPYSNFEMEMAQSCIRPYYWPFASLVHTLYPSFLSYFPEASLMQMGLLLHQLSPAQRKDSVALMNASREPPLRIASRGGLRVFGDFAHRGGGRSPHRAPSSRPVSGGLRGVGGSSSTSSAGGDGRVRSSRLTPSTGGRRRSAAGSWVGRVGGAAEHVTLDETFPEAFPTKWLSGVSNCADIRRVRLNQALDNFHQ